MSDNVAFLSDDNNDTTNNEPSTSSNRNTQYSFTPTPENSKTSTKPDLKDSSNDEESEKRDDSAYVCNICLDIAREAVISICGHLYCWPCLNTWLETRPHRQLCPVCKAAISREKVIPLYGRNSEKIDPRNKTPPRPQAQRSEPESSNGFQGFQSFGGDGGFHLSFGIGAFPFGFFASSFNFNDMRPRNPQQAGLNGEDQFLSKLFLYVAMIFFFWLILA